MRKKLYALIDDGISGVSSFYDGFMLLVIVISLIPLTSKETTPVYQWMEWIATGVFVVDYLLRWLTADCKHGKKAALLYYPATPMAIVDLLAILPSFTGVAAGWKLLKLLRMTRTLRVLRALKMVRYSKNLSLIFRVFQKQRRPLLCVCTLAIAYIILSALVIFNVEPESFPNFFDAVYWATVSLTTVGYGDICPVTAVGKLITMFSALFGIAVIALPSGILTAGYMREIAEEHRLERAASGYGEPPEKTSPVENPER